MLRLTAPRSLVALFLVCLLAACGGGSSHSTDVSPSTAEVQDALDAITATGVTGALLRLGGPFGKEVLTSGVADPDTGRRATTTSTFRIASISKAFSGAVVLSLVRDGRVALDDTVERWLPGQLPDGGEVHVRELLNHTGGVYSYTDDPDFLAELAADPLALWTPEELVAVAARHDLKFQPGTAYSYSNTDNIILALIAEAASGETYDALLQSRVLRKIGLRHTALPSTPALPDPFIRGFFRNDDGSVEDVSEVLSPTAIWASGAIISTADDLARFIGALVAGDLYGPALRAEAMTVVAGDSDPPGPPGPGSNSAGLALFRYDAECATVWGHTGRLPGYRNYAFATPDGRRTLVLTLNQEPSADAAHLRILNALELAICRLVDR